MNSMWLKAILIISLCINCMIAGGVTYKFFFTEPYQMRFEERLQGDAPPVDFSQRFRSARREFREKTRQQRMDIRQERDKLMELLMQEPPDRIKINKTLDRINKSQTEVQKMVIDRILEEIQGLPPEQKQDYLKHLKRRMGLGKVFGMGKGRHRDREWRDRRNYLPE